jgi:alpha-1,6-mannosyltransferase
MKFGRPVGIAFTLITALQFHVPFYASRTLPNTFALASASLAHAEWLAGRRPHRAILLLAFTVVSTEVYKFHLSPTFAAHM